MSARSLGWSDPQPALERLPRQLADGVRGFLLDTHYGHPHADGKVYNDDVKTPLSSVYLCHEYCHIGSTPL